jgi:hypothetical protein
MQGKKALVREAGKRHQKAQKREKELILNEPVKTTGYSRKYVLHVPADRGKAAAAHLGRQTDWLKGSVCKRWKRKRNTRTVSQPS